MVEREPKFQESLGRWGKASDRAGQIRPGFLGSRPRNGGIPVE